MRIRFVSLCLVALSFTLLAGCFKPIELPRAEFAWSYETPFDVSFDATSSDGGDSVLIAWDWTYGDGETGTGELVRHTFAFPGDYKVELTVTDARGFHASTRHAVRAVRELLVPEEFWTIQEAIDDAGSGDIVIVSPGRYMESFTFRGKAICVRSVAPDDPAVVASTIIEPGQLAGDLRAGPAVTFDSGEGPDSVLEGLTIRGVEGAAAMFGNGVVVRSSSPTIRGNVFANHMAGSAGAAMYLVDSAAVVTENRFDDNTCDPLRVGEPTHGYSSEGGAIKVICAAKAPRILDNQFTGNTAIAGGAIYVAVANMGSGNAVARVKIEGNTFISNRATGKYAPSHQTTEVGGAIQAQFESLVDFGPRDTNSYYDNLPCDVYYGL